MLTEAVDRPGIPRHVPSPQEIARLESKICAESLTLADQMLHEACHDIEDLMVERVMTRLRRELPLLIRRLLHEHFDGGE